MRRAIVKLSRRDFLKAGLSVGAGLTLGVHLELGAEESHEPFAPNAFVRIGVDDSVTIIAKHIEFGQGSHTGLATLLAEELDADWAQIKVEAAPADASRYGNLNWGGFQGTGGSSSINNSWRQMREAGAMARALLVAAAAADWHVPADEISVHAGRLRHPASARESGFGAFAGAAAELPLPAAVALKQPRDFVLIGHDHARVDRHAKTHGAAVYTIDFTLPELRWALVLHTPRLGATPQTIDDKAARAIPGVVSVLRLDDGVAVVAETFWAAKRGRDALKVSWDEQHASNIDSAALRDAYRALAAKPGQTVHSAGDADAALATAPHPIEALYELPYLAHAAMEPLNCVVRLSAGSCELWYGAQSMTGDQANVARLLGIAPDKVSIHQLYAGGSFGRRADPRSDYVLEAVRIAKALGDGRPLKLQWTREDDMRGARYRPAATHALRGALDGDGKPLAWAQRIVCQSLWEGSERAGQDGSVDKSIHEGASDLPYSIPNLTVEAHVPTPGVPVLWWRSVGHTHTAFAVESFIDELAHVAKADPLVFRRALLRDDPRRLAVLDLAAREAGWDQPLAAGRGRGIAAHRSFGTWVAEVVEVTLKEGGDFSVDKVTVAVDCGIAVNPDIVRAQMEGGVGYALSAALEGAISFKNGVVQEDNFDTYRPLRLTRMPLVAVHILPSGEAPTGVGEPAVPPLAPALANALFAASGKRWRTLPFRAPQAT